MKLTEGRQRSHEYQSLLYDYYLSGVPASVTDDPVASALVEARAIAPAELDIVRLSLLAEQGDARAQKELGARYEDGRGGLAQNDAEAVRWLRPAAQQGDPDAQHRLGLMYADGRGLVQDEAEAVWWFRQAADQGDADAQHGRGLVYAEGRGVQQDDGDAIEWFRLAAAQDHAGAQLNLGFIVRPRPQRGAGLRRSQTVVPAGRRTGRADSSRRRDVRGGARRAR